MVDTDSFYRETHVDFFVTAMSYNKHRYWIINAVRSLDSYQTTSRKDKNHLQMFRNATVEDCEVYDNL